MSAIESPDTLLVVTAARISEISLPPRKYKIENDAARSAAGKFGSFVTHMNRNTIEIVSSRAASSRIIVVDILDGCSIPTDIGVVLVL